MKRIMFFSWQHLWSMGNGSGAPSYHHTLNHYINSDNWDVYVFTTDQISTDLAINQEGKILTYQDRLSIESMSSTQLFKYIVLPVKIRNFTKWAVEKATGIIESTPMDTVIYGYDGWCIPAAKTISDKFNLTLITRFMGTVRSYEVHSFFNRVRHYPEYSALQAKADLIIMTNDGTMGDKTIRSLGNASPLLFLRNGLDLYDTCQEIHKTCDITVLKNELGISVRNHILLMASRLTGWKRVDRGIRVLREVLKKRDDVFLFIAGDGDSRSELESLADELHVSSHTVFLGSIPQREVYKYMLCADVFMSLYDMSNLGNPTFEAMLMKKAIIALNGGDTSTVIRNGETGILLEYSQEDMIPVMIEKLIEDDAYRRKLEEGAFQFAIKNFYSWDTRMKMEEESILEAMKNHSKS